MGGHVCEEVWGTSGQRGGITEKDRCFLRDGAVQSRCGGGGLCEFPPPSPTPTPKLQELKKLVQDQCMAMEGPPNTETP